MFPVANHSQFIKGLWWGPNPFSKLSWTRAGCKVRGEGGGLEGCLAYKSESQGSEAWQGWVLREEGPWDSTPFSPASTSTGLV